jgi:hypothetical protein
MQQMIIKKKYLMVIIIMTDLISLIGAQNLIEHTDYLEIE